ncbi:hypothetical protein SAMN05428949_2480 [Chitinophaga sp. YR627]|uniref:hypothetical protein n=1 Tax=Chitinophaga sp. YR627 TaxID=1881041 RepID=UPI0008E12028|nr:hypothetical protein [Chitinophaga sp. YR627]SFN33767.1 hypothetical protein SAMN05428949_2480 [Chitinophaga sp. YR627]
MKQYKKRHLAIKVLIAFLLIAGGGSIQNKVAAQTSCTCDCLKPLFDYLITSNRLLTKESEHVVIASLIKDARNAGYNISYTQCAILYKNINNNFYALTADTIGTQYRARVGDCEVSLTSSAGNIRFDSLRSDACTGADVVTYHRSGSSGSIAQLKIGTCYTCEVKPAGNCYSAVTDTSVNPYVNGMAGNWRVLRNYKMYTDRNEIATTVAAHARRAGTIANFTYYYKLDNNKWVIQPDTVRWLWMGETTLYGRRGQEMETKDPLGRYSSGLFGYDDALPVAVSENARYRETVFDGFEDYFLKDTACRVVCESLRGFDFSPYKSHFDTTQQHTGRYSLKVDAGATYGIGTAFVNADSTTFRISFNTDSSDCKDKKLVLKSIRVGKEVLLPTFSPLAGKRLLMSAWVKEGAECKGSVYTGNQVVITIRRATDSVSITAVPAGNIIEGWQRYEQPIDVPTDAVSITLYLRSTGSVPVYFDDIRLHPYNANMKSFVYSPDDLRLMAELDENNYATMYEYDDDGTLIRLKKETERGIKTITETRNSLQKEVLP